MTLTNPWLPSSQITQTTREASATAQRRDGVVVTIAQWTSILVMLVGCAVIAGWVLGVPWLVSLRPDLVSMKFNAALCFLLTGAALFSASKANESRVWRLVSTVTVATVFVLSTATILEIASGQNFGIDELFVTDFETPIRTSSPGRMAPTTAFSFLLLSSAIASILMGRKTIVRTTGSIVVFFVSFLSLTGYVYDISALYQVNDHTAMAALTALCFIGLSTASLFINPPPSIIRIINAETPDGLLLRRLIPAVIIFPLVLGWLRQLGVTFDLYTVDFGEALFTLAIVLLFLAVTWRAATHIKALDLKKQTIELEKAKLESLAREQEAKARSIMESIVDTVITFDDRGVIASANHASELVLGYENGELVGKNIEALMPNLFRSDVDDQNRDDLDEQITKILRKVWQTPARRKDGTTFIAELSVNEFVNGGGRHFSAIVRDISQRVAAETELRKWHHIFLHAGWAVALTRPDDRTFVDVNHTFALMHGYKVSELIGEPMDKLLAPETLDTLQEILKIADEQGDHSYEGVRLRKDGSTFPALNQISSFKDDDGKVTFRVGTFQDLSAMKREESLQRAKRAAEIANEAKSAFLANMSHEIRTPLGAVLGFSELLANPNLSSSEKINYVAAIKRNGELLSSVIGDILDISKVEAGKLDVEMEDVLISSIVHDISVLLNLRALEKGIKLSITSEGPIPKSISTDPARLRQILLNVVGNAIKFTQKGHVLVKIKQVSDHGQLKLAFIVKDTGCGLSDEQKVRLFTPFSQADASTTRKYGGTGLGLVLAKKLANLLGGDVVLTESRPGLGSTFTITLDPGASETVLFENLDRPESRAVSIVPREVNLKGVNVLLVEDAPDNQMLLGHLLRSAGATVQMAANGKEAVDFAEGDSYDIILMDIQMPVMDGYQAIKKLRGRGYRKPILALTAHAMKEERERCLMSGFDDHLSKPVQREALLEAVSRYSRTTELQSLH